MNITTAYQLTEVLRKQSTFREDFDALLIYFSRAYLANSANTDIPAKIKDLIHSSHSYRLFPNIKEENTWQFFLANNLDFNHISFEDFREISNQLLNFISYGDKPSNHKFGGSTHVNLLKKLVELADLQSSQIIYDPACGYGNIFKEIYRSTPKIDISRNTTYTLIGQELDFLTCFIAQLNLSLNGIEANILQGDALKAPPYNFKGKIDTVISHIPFGTRLNRNELVHSSFLDSAKIPNAEYAFVELALSMIHDKGKVIMIIPASFLRNDEGKELRKNYIKNHWIEKIIDLPVGIINGTNIKTAILVLNKEKDARQQVIFEEYDKELNSLSSETVSDEIIEQNGFNLNIIRYLHPFKKEFDQLLQTHKNEIVKLTSIVEVSIGSSLSKKIIEDEPTDEAIPYIGISLLKQNSTDFRPLQIDGVDRFIKTEDVSNSKLIDYSAILLGIGSGSIKSAYFKYENQAIVIGTGVFAIKVKDTSKVSIEYLMIHLHSRFVKIQIEIFSIGYMWKHILLKDFSNIKIILPSLEVQKAHVFEFKEQLLREKRLELGLQESKQATKLTEFDVIGIAVHNLGHKLASMKANLTMLQNFITQKSMQGEVIRTNEPIVPVFEEDTPEEIQKLQLDYTLQNVINTLEEAISQIYTTREEIQNNSIQPQKINITKFFKEELKPLYESSNFYLEVKGESIEAEIDKNSFKNLVRNLVNNAQHYQAKSAVFELSYLDDESSLTLESNSKYNLNYLVDEGSLTLESNPKYNKFSILFKNDGLPFPEDFDFERDFKGLYQKSSYSEGSGIGGYVINKIIELHGGIMKNVSPSAHSLDLYKVQIEFILPIHHTPNPIYVKSNSYSIN